VRAARGMTLIEIVVALGIATVLLGTAVMGVGALTGTKAKEASVELAGTIRSLYDMAALSGKTCRLVFDLPDARQDEGAVTWRAECAKGNITAGAKRDDELREANAADKRDPRDQDKRLRRMDSDEAPSIQELQAREKERVDAVAKFSEFSSQDVATHTLPSSVRVEVWTHKQRLPVKNGHAYLYFFPQGYTERAQVWLRQGRNTWTLSISPLTGKTVISSDDLEVPRT
jgi:general secretion pathway protein H